MLTRESIRLKSGRSWELHVGGEGPALVWLHGVRGVETTDPFLAALSTRHRIIAPVAPGVMDLAELGEISTIHDLALDYDDLLRHLRLDAVAIVGHSFGAMAAAEIAAHFPERARRLVLIAPVGLWNDADPVADIFAVPPPEMDRLLWHDEAARDAFTARRDAAAGEVGLADRMVAQARSLAAATTFAWPIPERGLRRRLRRITAPTLIVFGAADLVVPPRYAEDFAAALAQSESTLIPAAGHMVPYEKTAETAAIVERFLAG